MNNDPSNYICGDLSLDKSFDLWVLLSRTYSAISRLRELELLPVGISTAQAQILNTIHNAGGELTITQISKYTLHQHHSVSNLINKMSKQGLIKKVKARNSREYKISITPKGQSLYDKVSSRLVEIIFSYYPKRKTTFGRRYDQIEQSSQEFTRN
jgi:DNA-binding MarR family transcriptional regulator